MNKLKKLFSKEMLINYIFVFYIISIFLDLHIFYNSISTLIRVIIISLIFLTIFIKYANSKERKLILFYLLLNIVYIIFHLLNVSNFNISFYTKYNYIKEILYFIKMFMNIFIIYIVYKLEIDKDKFYKLITISAFLISSSIIITNIFKIGYTSYEFNPVKYNLFDWFKISNIYFYEASSKGYFHLTNQISAVLILYLPLLLIYLKERINIYKIITILFVIISLFMLGTRVSSYSPFIIISVIFIIYISSLIVERNTNYKYILLLFFFFLLSFGLYKNCPLLSRNLYYTELFKESEIEINNAKEKYENIDIKQLSIEEFKESLALYNIDEDFYNTYYKLENDREFYENYINMSTTKINDTRFLELQIIKRVKELNNNKLDNYFGIGYDRVINIFNIEQDYVMQYYAIGIIGCILLLGVNILIILYIYFKTLFNLKRYFTFENLMLMFSSTYFLISTYFTGNVLNSISCIIPISFVLGYALFNINKKENKEEYEYYLGFKTTTKNIDEITNLIFKEKKQTIIFNINPLIINNFYKNKKVRKEFNNENYNIPDGNGIVLVSKLTSNNLNKCIPGIELMEQICKESINKKYTIYLYGAKEDSVVNTKNNLEKEYKNIKIVGYKNGYTNEDDVVKDILNKKPDILFVALGSPKQEEFIINNKKTFKNIKIIMPVGGSFDVLSGNIKRAPQIFRKLKIEWLYRMLKEPKRFKQLLSILKFVLLVLFKNYWYNEEE